MCRLPGDNLDHHSTGLYTLCFIHQGNQILLLKRENEPNSGFYNGIGGKISRGESVEDGLLREVAEETGFRLLNFELKGILRFIEGREGKDYLVFTYFSSKFEGEMLKYCPEGFLEWVDSSQLDQVPLVSNIPVFLPILEKSNYPRLITFQYSESGKDFRCTYVEEGRKVEQVYEESVGELSL
jgi:8-oxo-dGTP diphosphatase